MWSRSAHKKITAGYAYGRSKMMPVVGSKNIFFQVPNMKNFILDAICILKTEILDADQLDQVLESESKFPITDLKKDRWKLHFF